MDTKNADQSKTLARPVDTNLHFLGDFRLFSSYFLPNVDTCPNGLHFLHNMSAIWKNPPVAIISMFFPSILKKWEKGTFFSILLFTYYVRKYSRLCKKFCEKEDKLCIKFVIVLLYYFIFKWYTLI